MANKRHWFCERCRRILSSLLSTRKVTLRAERSNVRKYVCVRSRLHFYVPSRAQLFEGQLALDPGLNLTPVSFSLVSKAFYRIIFSVIFKSIQTSTCWPKELNWIYFLKTCISGFKFRSNLGLLWTTQPETLGSLYDYGKLLIHPSPKPTFTLSSHLGQNVALGEW